MNDVIDELAGVKPGSRLDAARDGRAEARRAAQESYELLLHPREPGAATLLERHAVAAFVAALHGDETVLAHYRALLERTGRAAADVVLGEAERGRTGGPYGRFPGGPLSAEDEDGLHYTVSAAGEEALGERLATALEHAHLLVFHPRDAGSHDLQRLLNAGWSTTGVVTLSQLAAFLAFQIRVVAGLRQAQRVFARATEVNRV